MSIILIISLIIVVAIVVVIAVINFINAKYKELESEVLKKLNFSSWNIVPYFDERVIVKSRQALEKYDDIKFFKENKEKLAQAKDVIERKNKIATVLSDFL